MNSTVPYIAPWQSGFERFAVQLFTPLPVTNDRLRLVIPDGQWWRVIYMQGTFTSDAAAGSRAIFGEVLRPNNAQVIAVPITNLHGPSLVGQYIFAPGFNGYSTPATSASLRAAAPFPDVLWQPGLKLQLEATGADVGDSWSNSGVFAVEIYTEDRPGVLVPKLTPTPLIP